MPDMNVQTVDDVIRLYADKAHFPYDLSGLNQLEHALQSADLAMRVGEPEAFVVACLTHDLGHLLHREDAPLALRGVDDRHEISGARILARLLGEDVAGPVRLHVAAKRYLCAAEDSYFSKLSQDSVRSLALQGGPMTDEECDAFTALPHFRQAVALRRIDEAAKEPGAQVAPFETYVPSIRRLARPIGGTG
jgi:predicted HD phosphohydrolase